MAEGTASGLTSGGVAVRLYINDAGTLVTGSTASSVGGAGVTVFTLALDPDTGVLTQTQFAVIDHTATDTYAGAYIADVASLADDLVELVASAETTDSEDDTSGVNTATLDLGGNVRFGDDGPEVEFENLVGTNGTTDAQVGDWIGLPGADMPASVTELIASDFTLRRGTDGSIDQGTVAFDFDPQTDEATGRLLA